MGRSIARLSVLAGLLLLAGVVAYAAEAPIDMQHARELFQKMQSGQTLSPDEQQYLQRARAAFQAASGPALKPKDSMDLVPICDMSATDRYKGEDGGLYGGGQNTPPDALRQAAEAQLAQIKPLDATGQPSANGKIVFVSISMSNATMEFSAFKKIADIDPHKSPKLTIVDCAQGGKAMAQWAPADAPPWQMAEQRLQGAGIADPQVQVAWIKIANMSPTGDLKDHGAILERDTTAVLNNAKAKFPNLRLVYLDSRIYGGYASGRLNPEPYAYEGGFVVRWLIQKQLSGAPELNFDSAKGAVKSPLLLWGPYLWANGVKGRKIDDLVWLRPDLGPDGTHPSDTGGRPKVAKLLLNFFTNDPLACSWFTGSSTPASAASQPAPQGANKG